MTGLVWNPEYIEAMSVRARTPSPPHVHGCPHCYEKVPCDMKDCSMGYGDFEDHFIRLASTIRPPLLDRAAVLVLPNAGYCTCDRCRPEVYFRRALAAAQRGS